MTLHNVTTSSYLLCYQRASKESSSGEKREEMKITILNLVSAFQDCGSTGKAIEMEGEKRKIGLQKGEDFPKRGNKYIC